MWSGHHDHFGACGHMHSLHHRGYIHPGLLFLVRSHGCVVVRWKSLRRHTREMSSPFHTACDAKFVPITILAATYDPTPHKDRQMCSDRKGQANVCHSDIGIDPPLNGPLLKYRINFRVTMYKLAPPPFRAHCGKPLPTSGRWCGNRTPTALSCSTRLLKRAW